MTALPSPANVPSGFVVRVFVGGRVLTSGVMSKAEAEELAADLEDDVVESSRGHGFVSFTLAGARDVRLRARSVTQIEPSALPLVDQPGRAR